MSLLEFSLCIAAVLGSSIAQLCVKAAASQPVSFSGFGLLAISACLMLLSSVVSVWVLQTVRLSQLIPFAAGAYILVPLGGRIFFKERVAPLFWLGVIAIALGIICTLI